MPSRRKLRRLWFVVRAGVCFGVGCALIFMPLGTAIREGREVLKGHAVLSGLLVSGALAILAALVSTPTNRGRFLHWLGGLGKNRSMDQEAAAVAALVGGKDAAQVMAMATDRFTALALSRLNADDLKSNQDTGLNTRIERAQLGEVTAFMSHSWRDDGEQKYAMLRKWSATIGEGATIWLDKVSRMRQILHTCLPVLTLPSHLHFFAGLYRPE